MSWAPHLWMTRVYAMKACSLCGDEYEPNGSSSKYCRKCCPDRTTNLRILNYGLSAPMYDALLAEQDGKCALCEFAPTEVDHDHATGRVRGILCAWCNSQMAGVDNKEWLSKAKIYANSFLDFADLQQKSVSFRGQPKVNSRNCGLQICPTCDETYIANAAVQIWCSVCKPNLAAGRRIRWFGITEPMWLALLYQQDNHCALCDKPAKEIDHRHHDGLIRGVLCTLCNRRMAAVDDTRWLERAEKYGS
jgi:hypothetical protein